MLKAIIFDMDGVLVNSVPYIRQSFTIMLKKYWVDISTLDRKKYLGKRLAEQIQMRKKEFNIQEEIDVDNFSNEAQKLQKSFMEKELIQNPNIIKLFEEAKNNNIKLAVATWSTKQRAIDMLKLIWVFDYLDCLVTSEDVKNGKPAPDTFLKAAKLINIQPENCLVIEDAANWIQAARRSNMKVIGRVWAHHTKEELSKIADMVFDDFKEISLKQILTLYNKNI